MRIRYLAERDLKGNIVESVRQMADQSRQKLIPLVKNKHNRVVLSIGNNLKKEMEVDMVGGNQSEEKTVKAVVVDDEKGIVDLLSRILERIGVETIKAYDGEAALELIQKDKPDIVFSDIYMPKLNGLALLKKLKALDKKMPVIIFTGYEHYKQMTEMLEVKPDNFLSKPLDVREIIEIMLAYFPQLRRE